MSGDGQGLGGDGADWLLAQLAGGEAPRRDVQPPPVAPPAQPVQQAAPAAPSAPRTPAPRREEVLDWFSEAPAPGADAVTAALPVVGSPAPRSSEPPQQYAPTADAAGQPSPAPSWTPPFAVGLPHEPPAAAPVYLTAVEPPVGTPAVPPVAPAASAAPVPPVTPAAPFAPAAPVAPAAPAAAWPPAAPSAAWPAAAPSAAWPPAAPAAPIQQAAPAPAEAPSTPPGPVTPTAPFALTWGADEALSSEDAIRAAFRNLSEPPTATSDVEWRGHGATAPAAPVTPAAPMAPVAPVEPAAPVAPADSPFAGFAPPPVARQSFTPVQPAEPVTPPVHPTAPSTAPAGWDARQPVAPQPASYDDELWAALNEPEQASAPQASAFQSQTLPPVQPVAQPQSVQPVAPVQPVAHVAPEPPVQQAPRPERDRFAAFAADTTDPFAALTETRAVPIQPAAPAPVQPDPVAQQSAAPQFERNSRAVPDAEPDARTGFPFLEVRGMAAAQENAAVGAPIREASAFNTTPFPAFASASGGDDDPTREPPAPVDDLLASLGGGAPRTRGAEPTPPSGGSGTTPPTPPAPSGLDALGLDFDDDETVDAPANDADEREPSGIRGRFFGARFGEPDADQDRDRDAGDEQEVADAGYIWNLTPDPNAKDPKDSPASVATAFLGENAAVGSNTADDFAADDASPAWDDEPALEAAGPDWAFPNDAEPSDTPAFSTDTAPYGDDLRFAASSAATNHEASDDDDAMGALFGAAAANDPFGAASSGQTSGSGFPATPAQGPGGGGIGPQRTGGGGAGGPGSGGGGGRGGSSGGTGGSPAPKGGNRTTRTLIWVAGGLVVLLVLAGLYFLGTQLTGGGGEQASGGPSASSSETPVAAPTAPQPAGVHAWDTLFGGECIDPFESVWAEEFTVVDCAAPHAAQLVYRGTLPGDEAAPFPGEAQLVAEMPALCRAAGVFEPTLVAGIPDLQVQGSFPVTEEQWAEGQRNYYCFANRAGGEPLTGPINGPGPTA
ncbi:hypothetical protein [Agromyces sp. NPDC056965]|uniref:hypothetical protein n=1 Tax=Agromyces sp. NPDC056965 TaxID=3345983 RepID=UPI0036430C3E